MCGQAVWALAASAGVAALLVASEPAFVALKIAGAAYLVYLGVQTLWPRRTRRPATIARARGRGHELRQGLLSNLGNPKMASLLQQPAARSSATRSRRCSASGCVLRADAAWLIAYAYGGRARGRRPAPPARAAGARRGHRHGAGRARRAPRQRPTKRRRAGEVAVAYRPAAPDDEPFLLEMLWLAFHWRDESAAEPGAWPDPEAPRRYLEGFGRPGDAGVIAEEAGTPVGAAWYRLLPADDPGYGWVEGVPELTIAVAAAHRGQGIAGELITRLVDRAREDGFSGVSLSVEPDNAARRLYERLGFEKVGEVGGAWTLLEYSLTDIYGSGYMRPRAVDLRRARRSAPPRHARAHARAPARGG